ncbi:MAG: hypothetical protein ACRDD8_03910 [Bacteroidales bacterium]
MLKKRKKKIKDKKRWRRYSHHTRYVSKRIGFPFDWGYILDLEYAKITSMLNFFGDEDNYRTNSMRKYLRIMKIVTDNVNTKVGYVNTRNQHRYFSDEYINHFKGRVSDEYVYYEKAFVIMHKFRAHYLRSWWY